MDVLTDVLSSLRISGRLYCRTELSAPWGMLLPPSDLAHFHVIERGSCCLKLTESEEQVSLTAGDLVVIPHGRGHQLADRPETPAVPLGHLVPSHAPGISPLVRHGGGGAATMMICGGFQFERRESLPLLGLLPPVLHIRGDGGRTVPWLETTLRFLGEEARASRPGAPMLIGRLIDVIFVMVIRSWIESQGEGQGWLGALRDEHIGAALALIHGSPEQAWTVASLATAVAMSRSAFAARFSALTGEPPLEYLTRLRMHVAAGWLRDGALSIGEIAARIGYGSEAAFSKAFKRRYGMPPGAYRRGRDAA